MKCLSWAKSALLLWALLWAGCTKSEHEGPPGIVGARPVEIASPAFLRCQTTNQRQQVAFVVESDGQVVHERVEYLPALWEYAWQTRPTGQKLYVWTGPLLLSDTGFHYQATLWVDGEIAAVSDTAGWIEYQF